MEIITYIKGLFSNDLYVRIWEHRLKVVNIDTKAVFDEEPLIAIKKNKAGQSIVAAMGNACRHLVDEAEYTISNPFSHPRVLVANFTQAEKILQQTLLQTHQRKRLPIAPRVIIQPMEKLQGGITEIEYRVYHELCAGAGAREVYVHIGAELSADKQVFEQVLNEKNH